MTTFWVVMSNYFQTVLDEIHVKHSLLFLELGDKISHSWLVSYLRIRRKLMKTSRELDGLEQRIDNLLHSIYDRLVEVGVCSDTFEEWVDELVREGNVENYNQNDVPI